MMASDHGNVGVRLAQARKILDHYISIESESLCVVSYLNQKEKDVHARFDPENHCLKQMDVLFAMDEFLKTPHVLVLTAILWYRVISMQNNKMLINYSFAELLACSYAVALASAGSFSEEDIKHARQTHEILSKTGVLGHMSGETLRVGCLEIVEKLGFQLFEPTVLHVLDLLVELGCLDDVDLVDFVAGSTKTGKQRAAKNAKFYQTLLLMLREPRFLCLAPSVQAAGILQYLHIWNGSCARYLRRSNEEALNVAKLIYYRMVTLAYHNKNPDPAHQLFAMGFYDPRNKSFIENGLVGDIIHETVIFDMIDKMFSRVCNTGDCSVPFLSRHSTSKIPDPGANFPYSMIPADEFSKKFQTIKRLGQGSYGEVVQTIELATGVHYALKFMHLDMNDQMFFTHLINMIHEIAGMRYLHSERGIMNTVHAFYIPDIGAIVQQVALYEGSLYGLIQMNHSLAFYKSTVQGALAGLQKIHDKGLVHCDVKSANILIDSNFQSVIADMGMLALPCTTTNSDNYYTVNYRAPEVSEHGRVTWQSDMWAVGIILLEFYHVIQNNMLASGIFIDCLKDAIGTANPQIIAQIDAGRIPWSDIQNSFIQEANMRFVTQSLNNLKAASENPFVDSAHEWGCMHDLLSRRLLIPITRETSRWTAAACLQHEFFQTP